MDKPAGQTELRILLLEDMPTDAELTENALRKAGLSFTAKRVDTREAFIQALEEFKPDIVLADYKLPAFDGGSAVKIVRQQYPTVPVIMVTGAMGDDKAVELLKLGARDYILKHQLARLGPAVQRAISEEQGIRARKAAEEELQKFFNLIPDLVCVASTNGYFLKINPAWQKLLGYTTQEILSKPFLDLVHPDDRAATMKEVKLQLAGKATMQFPNRYRCQDGSYKWLEWMATPADDNKLLFASARDITERKAAELKLVEQELQYRTLADSGQALIWASGTDKLCNYFNQPWLKFTGRALEQELDNGWAEGVHTDDLAQCLAAYVTAFDRRESFSVAYRLRRYDGEYRWIQDDACPRYNAEGKFIGYIGYCLDITERKNAEDKLALSERHFRAVTESANDAIITGDAADNIIGWNAAAERLFGYTEAEIVGQPLMVLLPERFRNLHMEGLARVVAGGVHHVIGKTVELAGLHKDGSEFPLELSLAQWRVADGQFFTGIIRDITERKQAEARIQKLTRLYATLSQTNEIIVRTTSRQELFSSICSAAVTNGKFILAWVGLVDEATHRVKPVCHHGAVEGYLADIVISTDDVPEGRGPTGTAIRENRVFYVNDFATDERVWLWREAALKHGLRGAAGLPLRFKGKVIGALTLYTDEPGFFDADQVNLLEEMATDISFALEGFEREALRRQAEEGRETALQKLRKSLEDSIQVAASLSEMRDPYTAGHQQRVSQLAAAIASEMGLSEAQVEGIRFGSLIHDIGKIGVPAEILSKPSNLTPLEMQLIQIHPKAGYEIIKDIEFPWPVAQMTLQHHERLDGSGYPAGLQDGGIIPEARIIAVADTVEAMSSHRPYRPSLGMDAALAEIAGASGVRYDKQAVEACIRLIREKGFTFK